MSKKQMFEEAPLPEEINPWTYWYTKSIGKIKICDMTDEHLINSHKKITKNNWRTEYLPIIEKEIKRRKLPIPKYSTNFGCDATECDIY